MPFLPRCSEREAAEVTGLPSFSLPRFRFGDSAQLSPTSGRIGRRRLTVRGRSEVIDPLRGARPDHAGFAGAGDAAWPLRRLRPFEFLVYSY